MNQKNIIVGLVLGILVLATTLIIVNRSNSPLVTDESTQNIVADVQVVATTSPMSQSTTTATTTITVQPTPSQSTSKTIVTPKKSPVTAAPVQTQALAQKNVTISKYEYAPEVLTVKKGTMVTWTNQDIAKHTVTGNAGGPDSQYFGKGESYSYTFNTVGTFEYHCEPHPYMKAKVVVTE